MGVPLSILGKLGLPGVNSLTTDRVYDKYFGKKNIRNFNEFHVAFIDLCKDFNSIMPGKHYYLPPFKEIETLHAEYENNRENDEKRKEIIIEFMKKVRQSRTDDSAMITTGLVAPTAAMVLKKTSENTPLKTFKLHLIPNIVFVPTCTLLALIGVRVLQINNTSKE